MQKINWAAVAAQIAGDIDYGNFKDEVHKSSHDRATAYSDVWSVMYDVQTAEERQKSYTDLNRAALMSYSLFNETQTNTSQEK